MPSPALRDSGATLPVGTRALGWLVNIRNEGPGAHDSSATGDVPINPSVGVAMPVFVSRWAYRTPLRNFDNDILPGEVRDGCVAFAVGEIDGVPVDPWGHK